MISVSALVLAFIPVTAWAVQVQNPNLTFPYDTTRDRENVIAIFNSSYDAYRTYAFGHDQVAPSSRRPLDPRNGWGATIVDAMPTMHIMGLTDYFEEALGHVQTIDFSKSNTPATVSVFESTIRYIGGLLSAYELSGQRYLFLVDRAKQLADKLSVAWTRGGAIPYGYVNFNTSSPVKDNSNIAEAGTLTLEWARLSQYTGDDRYRKLAEAAALKIANNPAPLPGLPAQRINPSTGEPVGGYTWGGGSDSYFEYLIKYARLSNTDDGAFVDTWVTAVDSSIKYLMKESTVGHHVYLADLDDRGLIRHVGSHLACFHAGNWLLGGKLVNNDTIVSLALQLNDACWNTYIGDATGIGPDTFAFASSDGGYTGSTDDVPRSQLQFYSQHGYYITGAGYVQRPEVLESNFYAWRVTGNPTYIDRARSAVKNFNTYLNVSTGFAGIKDVNSKATTKDHISLDDYVFNTEAHPLIAPLAKSTYRGHPLRRLAAEKFVK
ncbi:glycoside hydrolase family 47 protein [Multifurca ochricompacta]|uniref:alpha-1,2-Mannosidase n=1 Tax=Multifurca ochricompacta TaxID=376703 RepID=A0AAD4M4C2_9AGAM|nr:glycoside hydrolase family 47 protein [Multifurca ochricompacta]